ncbi:MAG: VWA domain-containing protein [Bryobacterales bacterium]|nr:VWA domain-containing protein [Bryobacterales bacterium]
MSILGSGAKLAILTSLGPLYGLAQPSRPANHREQPRFSTTARMVEIDVLVHDKNGKIAGGLTRDDFVVKDGNKPQTIATFEIRGASTSNAPDVPAQPPPGVVSNWAEIDDPETPGSAIILLDRLNSRVNEQQLARREVIKFFESGHRPDRVAVLVLGADRKLRVLASFASAARVAATAVAADSATPPSSLKRMSDIDKMDPGDMDMEAEAFADARRGAAEYANQVRVEQTLRTLEAIARSLSGVRGRKSLIWLSSAFPLSMGYDPNEIMQWRPLRLNFGPRMARAARILTDANVAVYPVDTRGFAGAPLQDAANWSDGFGAQGAQIPPSAADARMSMQSIARATGGRAFFDRNDIGRAIGEVVANSASVYAISYQPSHDQWNGAFRPISVQVKRPGLKVSCRRGYFAFSGKAEEANPPLSELLESPLEATGLTLMASVTRDADRLNLRLVLDATRLTLAQRNERWEGALEVLLALIDPAGKIDVKETNHFIVPLSWTRDVLDLNLERGAGFFRVLTGVSKAKKLRVLVRDRTTGRTGSVTMPL